MPSDVKEFSQSLAAVSTFSSNILFWLQSGYFDTGADRKPLLHTWSLAVEEQYYIFFPLFMMLAWRFGKRRMVALMLAACFVSLVISEWASYRVPEAAFYLLPARGWELVIGAFAALYLLDNEFPATKMPIASQVLSLTGLSMILAAVLLYDSHTPFPGLYALLPTLGAVVVILFATPPSYVGRLLGSKLLVGIGLISYSAYLWHQPLFAFARHKSIDKPDAPFFLCLSVLSLFFAYLSWKFVETPFRKPGRVSRRHVFLFAGIGTALCLSMGLYGWKEKGIVKHYEPGDFALLSAYDLGPYVWDRAQSLLDHDFNNSSQPKILIIGDSYAGDIVNALYKSHLSENIQLSTHIIKAECGNLYLPTNRFINYVTPKETARCTIMGWYSEKARQLIREADSVWLISSWRMWTLNFLPESLSNLQKEFGDKFVVFGNKNFGSFNLTKLHEFTLEQRISYRRPIGSAILTRLREMINKSMFVDVMEALCGTATTCRIFTDKGDLISFDGSHLTPKGAQYVAGKLLSNPTFRQVEKGGIGEQLSHMQRKTQPDPNSMDGGEAQHAISFPGKNRSNPD